MKNSQLLRSALGLVVPLLLLGWSSLDGESVPAASQAGGDAAASLVVAAQAPYKKPAELSLHIFRGPLPAEGCVGDLLMLDVLAYPKTATYEWRKDGTPLVPAQTGPTLVLGSAVVSDTGSYDVVVSLGSQQRTSAPAAVAVHDGPTITVQPGPATQSVSNGTPISYSVTATGVGELTYKWRKKPLVPFSPFFDIPGATSPVLDLGNVNSSDAGTYRCIVTDSCGPLASRRCQLVIAQ